MLGVPPDSLAEAAALGDLDTVATWAGNINTTLSHEALPVGCTLLMAASSNGQSEVVRHLLARGANVNVHAQGGITALMFATTGGFTDTVRVLLHAKASLEAVELERSDHVRVAGRRTATISHTALQIAEAHGYEATACVLREHAEQVRRDAEAAAAKLLAEEEMANAMSSQKREKDRSRREQKRLRLRRGRREQAEQRNPQPASLDTRDAESESVLGEAPPTEPPPAVEVPAAAVAAARRRGAHLDCEGSPVPPRPPPSTPRTTRRGLHGAAQASAPLELEAASSSMLPSAASASASASWPSNGLVVAVGSSMAAAAAAELEEMQLMKVRAAAKASHMRELDERFEMLQLARATSNTSLAAMGSSTSLATLDSGEVADELACVICMENPTDATLVHGSTAHVCCCLPCAQNLKRLEQSCPMCRKPIESVLQLFFA